MKVEYINPFIIATKEAFTKMVGCEMERVDLYVAEDDHPVKDITGIIGLTGRARGCVAISMTRELAIRASQAMADNDASELNAEVADAVGELANMIAGGAKAQLEQFEIRISLPTVLFGNYNSIEFPSETPALCIDFESEWGDLTVQVALVEEAEVAAT